MELNYIKNIETDYIPQLTDEMEVALGVNATDENKPIDFSVTYSNPNLYLIFNFDLTQQQIDICNDIVNNFTPNPNYKFHNYFKINNSLENPSLIDYDIMGYNKKRTFIKGELREVGYYRDYNYTAKTYSDLVVLETRSYNRDIIGLAVSRDLNSIWYLNDGSTGLTKNYKKYYTPEEAIQEGIDRRNNCIAFAKTTLLDELAKIYGEPANQQYSFDLLTSVKTEMEYYSQGYRQPLVNAVSASTKPYLTENIKIKVIEQLTF